jgi:hypothetical protein
MSLTDKHPAADSGVISIGSRIYTEKKSEKFRT